MIYVLLPAFNEEQNLRAEVVGIDGACRGAGIVCEILVVDDGSTDGTADLARSLGGQYPVRLLSHERNRGLGAALRTGIADLVERAEADDCVVTKDADNSQAPELLGALSRRIAEGADVVIASRFQPGGREVGLALYRRLLSRAAGLVFRVLCPVPGVRDFTCGYRAFRAGVLACAWRHYAPSGGLIERGDFSATAELLLKTAALTDRIAEVPLVLRYDLKAGRSKMRVWRAVRGNLAVARAVRRQRLREQAARLPAAEPAPIRRVHS
jgi:dolichol-phosphate mannosyltransferase